MKSKRFSLIKKLRFLKEYKRLASEIYSNGVSGRSEPYNKFIELARRKLGYADSTYRRDIEYSLKNVFNEYYDEIINNKPIIV